MEMERARETRDSYPYPNPQIDLTQQEGGGCKAEAHGAEAEAIFDLIDVNKVGYLPRTELVKVLRSNDQLAARHA